MEIFYYQIVSIFFFLDESGGWKCRL